MTVINRLYDVNPVAVSIVRKGANRQMWFLRKSDGLLYDTDEHGGEPLLESPHREGVIAKADWSAVYCVVAEPGAREAPGMLAKDGDPEDEWGSEDEIRQAAHRFMKNGGLINRMHEDLEPYGQVVENAIALADLPVNGQTIRKGSWYLAIEPTDAGREAIESGEFRGVSLQGTGRRVAVEVEKADPKAQGSKGSDRESTGTSQVCSNCGSKVALGVKKCPNCGAKLTGRTGVDRVAKATGPGGDIARNEGKQTGPLRNLIKFYLKKPHPFRECVRDNRKRFGARAEAVCAALKDIGLQTTHWRSGKGAVAKAALDGGGELLAKFEDEAIDSLYDSASEAWHGRGLTDDDVGEALKSLNAATRANERAAAGGGKGKGGGVKRTIKKMAEALGIDVDDAELEEEEPLGKAAVATFAQRVAQREVEDDLPLAMDALRSSMYDALWPWIYPGSGDQPDAGEVRGALDTSLAQFHEHVLGVYDRVAGGDIAKSDEELRDDLATLRITTPAEEDPDDMGDTNRIEALEKQVGDLATSVGALTEGLQPIVDRVKEAQAPKLEDVQKQLADLQKSVEKLGQGGSGQPADESVQKSDDPLAGVLL